MHFNTEGKIKVTNRQCRNRTGYFVYKLPGRINPERINRETKIKSIAEKQHRHPEKSD